MSCFISKYNMWNFESKDAPTKETQTKNCKSSSSKKKEEAARLRKKRDESSESILDCQASLFQN